MRRTRTVRTVRSRFLSSSSCEQNKKMFEHFCSYKVRISDFEIY